MKRLAALAILAGTTPALGAQLADYGEPAIIEVAAPRAVVADVGGKTTLTLVGVDSLATLTAALHKQDQRIFEAFPSRELPQAWNSCNAMKEQNKVFHADGVNSLVAFSRGPKFAAPEQFLAAPPLVTASAERRRITGDRDGIARVMLVDAAFSSGNLSFTVKAGHLEPGDYKRIRILTECVFQ